MERKMRRIAYLGLALMFTLPPAAAEAGDGIDVGTIIGAGLGGVIGNQIGKGTGNTVATVAGVILGGVAGHSVDQGWSSSAPQYHSNTVNYAEPAPYYYRPNYVAPSAPSTNIIYSQYSYREDEDAYDRHRHHEHHHGYHDERPHWQQPVVYQQRTVVQHNYVPATYHQPPAENGYCREYTNHVVVGNHTQESYGTACLQPDGSWKIID
jgi:surface antigen